jgi:uncharacterized protein (DUF2344 family)
MAVRRAPVKRTGLGVGFAAGFAALVPAIVFMAVFPAGCNSSAAA